MANPTTNYGFVMPTSTDLVTDLPADFDVFGQAVDNQMLTNANAAIAKTIVDAKGDIIAATAADTVSRLAVGANNTVLTADSTAATGLKWATPTGETRPTFSAGRTTNQSFSASTYTKIQANSESWDSDSYYDASTNYRFTPLKAGYYTFRVTIAATVTCDMLLYKNGTNLAIMDYASAAGEPGNGSLMVAMNGSTDYVEAFVYGSAGSIYAGTYMFQGIWERAL